MLSVIFRSFVPLLTLFLLSSPTFAVDKKDFINRAGLMMMAPCLVQPYLDCLQVNQATCKQAVKTAGAQCSDRVPAKVSQNDVNTTMQTLGRCMSARIVAELNLSTEVMLSCRVHLNEKHAK